jgi:hypothetical protein
MSSPFAVPDSGRGGVEPRDDSLFGELAVSAAIAVVAFGLVTLAATRRPAWLVSAPMPVLVAGAGIGACVFVFERAGLADVLGFDQRDAVDTGAVAIAAGALVAIVAGRTVAALVAVRDERRLELEGAEVAEQVAALTLVPAVATTLVGMLAAGAMLASDLYPARELGLALSAGLLFDLVLVRVPLLAFSGRRIG